MSTTVKMDRRGRVVIPKDERERLGVRDGGALELIPTPEGVLLEVRRDATVRVDEHGLPVATIAGLDAVSNDEAVGAIRRHRDGMSSTRR